MSCDLLNILKFTKLAAKFLLTVLCGFHYEVSIVASQCFEIFLLSKDGRTSALCIFDLFPIPFAYQLPMLPDNEFAALKVQAFAGLLTTGPADTKSGGPAQRSGC